MAGLKFKPLHKVVNQLNSNSNNQYTPLNLTPADCQKHFHHKLMFRKDINTEINIKIIKLVWLVSLFNGISTLFRLFNAKAILLEEQ